MPKKNATNFPKCVWGFLNNKNSLIKFSFDYTKGLKNFIVASEQKKLGRDLYDSIIYSTL
jgi:hypothetical protein